MTSLSCKVVVFHGKGEVEFEGKFYGRPQDFPQLSATFRAKRITNFEVQRNHEEIVGLKTGRTEGFICICDLYHPKDLEAVQALTASEGAVAFIQWKKIHLDEKPLLPTVVMERCDMFKAMAFFPGVRVQIKDTSPVGVKTSSDNIESSLTQDMSDESGELGLQSDLATPAVPVTTREELEQYDATYSEVAKKSIFGRLYDGVKEVFMAEPVFKATTAEDPIAYFKSSAARVEKYSNIEDLAKEAVSFLSKNDWRLCHVAVGVLVLNRFEASTKTHHQKLHHQVFRCFELLHVTKETAQFLRVVKSPSPYKTLFEFLIQSVRKNQIPVSSPIMKCNIVFILLACRLLKVKFDAGRWRALRSFVGPILCEQRFDLFHSHFDGIVANTLVLIFQEGVESIVETARRLRVRKADKLLANILVLLLGDALDSGGEISFAWKTSLPLLRSIEFCGEKGKQCEAAMEDVLKFFSFRAAFEQSGDFGNLLALSASLTTNDWICNAMKRLLEKQVEAKLRGRLEFEDIDSFLSVESGFDFNSRLVSTALLDVLKRTALKWPRLESKMVFALRLKTLKITAYHHQDDLVLSFLTRSFQDEESSPQLFIRILNLFATRAEDFSIAALDMADVNFRQRLIRTLMCSGGGNEFVASAESWSYAGEVDTSGTFLQGLFKEIRYKTVQTYKDVKSASALLRVVESSSVSAFVELARSVFREKFLLWNPQSICDFLPEHSCIMDTLFREQVNEIPNDEGLSDCRRSIEKIVKKWISRYKSQEITRREVQHIQKLVSSGLWNSFHSVIDLGICASEDISAIYNEFPPLEASIRERLLFNLNSGCKSMEEILREYQFDVASDSNISSLLKDYDASSTMNQALWTRKTLRQMKSDSEFLDVVLSQYGDVLSVCCFFLINPSVLFREAVLPRSCAFHCFDSLVDAVAEAVDSMGTMIGPCSTYSGAMIANTTLKGTSRHSDPIEAEMVSLKQSNVLNLTDEDVNGFYCVSLLAELRDPLTMFINFCERMEFRVVSDDRAFGELSQCVKDFFMSPDDILVDECVKFFRKLCAILIKSDPNDCLSKLRTSLRNEIPCLHLLAVMAKYAEVWLFISEMKWFGEDGLKRFYKEYGNVTNVLLGNSSSYEMSVLDAMEPVVRLISAMGSLGAARSIQELFRDLLDNDECKEGLKGALNRQIAEIHLKLSEVKEWFSSGGNELYATFSLYKSAMETGFYSLHGPSDELLPKQLVLTMTVDRDGHRKVRTLDGESLEQFIQQLSLIRSESEQTSRDLQLFVDQFQVLSDAAQNLLLLLSAGFEEVDFDCKCGAEFLESAKNVYRHSVIKLAKYREWLRHNRELYPIALLYWPAELKNVYDGLISMNNENLLDVLHVYVERIQPLCRDEINLGTIQFAIERHNDAHVESNWSISAARFLTEILKTSGMIEASRLQSHTLFLHSLCCNDEHRRAEELRVLMTIYSQRLPYTFEILDGSMPCNPEMMDLFLQRVLAFPQFIFTITQTEALESGTLEVLQSFLSDRMIVTKNVHLNLIQHGDSIHSVPWIKDRPWTCSIDTDETEYRHMLCSWRPLVVDMNHIDAIVVVSSNTCGSGKTRMIRRELKSFLDTGACSRAVSIPIHQQTTIASLMKVLRSKLNSSSESYALHLSFTFLPDEKTGTLLSQLNFFLFSLFVQRHVFDPETSSSWVLRQCRWRIFVEIPASSGCEQWLRRCFPILSSCAEFKTPSCNYEVDAMARRVSVYLRAYKTGTIDRKYDVGAQKRLVLVLDCSGSMEGQPYAAAVANALSIYDSHVTDGDEFAVTLFDHRVFDALPLQKIDGNKDTIRRLVIQNLESFYGGGTKMYVAMDSVLVSIGRCTENMESWIVCLTDGVSDNSNFPVFQQRLMSSPQNLHVVSIGINLPNDYQATMVQMSEKYHRPPQEGTKGFFVKADGTAVGINQAFEVVKSCIPVSQTFERDGHLSDDDCRELMREFQPDFVRPNDFIAQSFWVRFLFRRVTVFDSNEDFNYNETNDGLGSSLMRIMLAEVERLLDANHRKDWNEVNHTQLIYDFSNREAPEFKLVCTSPENMDPGEVDDLTRLCLPGFEIPSKKDLDDRSLLDRLLSQSLGVPLTIGEDGVGRLSCIDEHNFILTIDFAMKLLNIHERVECGIPCVLEGETGVSKTALTKMYSILRNAKSPQVKQQTFWQINVDASLTEEFFSNKFHEICDVALLCHEATVIVFLDEINTSSLIGFLKEVVIDRSIAGEELPDNVVIIAACNPARSQIQSTTRERDLGREWASGHYQVSPLPPSLQQLKWSFGSLTQRQEKEFIFRRMESSCGSRMAAHLRSSLTEIVSASHDMMRSFAARNILESLRRAGSSKDSQDLQTEADERALCVVSLRDIQRVFSLYEYFLNEKVSSEREESSSSIQRSSMLLAVALVYYLRLDVQSRVEFFSAIEKLPTETGREESLSDVLQKSLEEVIQQTEIPQGIAITQGLKENIFATLICSLSRTPLMIVGPPGSSKTLAVNTVSDNANGTDSIRQFYATRPRLSFFHYQCSKQSTSKEIAAVFELATQRQEHLDSRKHRCVVFMDEAGLPEEEKESLKVLHYLLEGHMSSKPSVGFVAISNHVLDAAKSNRCITLLRQNLDKEEMQTITMGVLFDVRADGRSSVLDINLQECLIQSIEFARLLCQSYQNVLSSKGRDTKFDTWFGLRDYVFFLKALRLRCPRQAGDTRMFVSTEDIVWAIERNFNGVTREEFYIVLRSFFRPISQIFPSLSFDKCIEFMARHPVDVLRDALRSESFDSCNERPRFKLIVDCTEDDSILRLLRIGKLADISSHSLYKLSNLSENFELEQLRLISGVKFAALQGDFAVLSQTGPVNESFYDLFNLRFQEITGRDGTVALYTNIAVGGISRRSLVKQEFECVIHTSLSGLDELPAPFLNRFEKFRLSLGDVLSKGWSKFGKLGPVVLQSHHGVSRVAEILNNGTTGFSWVGNFDTLQSIFLDLLPLHGIDGLSADESHPFSLLDFDSMSFSEGLETILCAGSSICDVPTMVETCIRKARATLDERRKELLQDAEKLFGRLEMRKMVESFLSSAEKADDTSEIAGVLTRMVVTLFASRRLIQLATPEAVFRNRELLPPELIIEYFKQEHFSLKQLLSQRLDANGSLLIVHTRSDQYIQKIPSFPTDRGPEHEQGWAVEVVRSLVCEHPDDVSIEHLGRLKSEASLRGVLETWNKNPRRRILLLVVDMSPSSATNQVNFIRTLVEQHLEKGSRKLVTLLLHYSVANSLSGRYYPALFLGGWDHIFLDGISNEESARLVHLACTLELNDIPRAQTLDIDTTTVSDGIRTVLYRILSHVASQNLFYKCQTWLDTENYMQRKRALETVIFMKICGGTLADIICEKFHVFWLNEALVKTTESASEALLIGTTNLPLSLSIQSTLVHAFQKFLVELLLFSNQWRNLDVLRGSASNDTCSNLFQTILRKSPTLPFEELMLRQSHQAGTLLRPMPATRSRSASALFPFFYFVSCFLDEVVESVFLELSRSADPKRPFGSLPLDDQVMEVFEECIRDLSCTEEKNGDLMTEVIDSVEKDGHTPKSSELSLFDRYLQQYVCWKMGCSPSPPIMAWWRDQLGSKNASQNVLCLHVIGRVQRNAAMRVSSIAALTDRFPDRETFDDVATASSVSRDDFEKMLDAFEEQVIEGSGREDFPFFVSTASELKLLCGSGLDVRRVECRFRRLAFLRILDPDLHSSSYPDVAAEVQSLDGFSITGFLEIHSIAKSAERYEESLLKQFLSPAWVFFASQEFLEEDLSFFLNWIARRPPGESERQLAKSVVRSVCEYSSRCPGGIRLLIQLNGALECCNVAAFSEQGRRTGLPHFLPSWLRENSPDAELGDQREFKSIHQVFFRDFTQSFDGNLAYAAFDARLTDFCDEAENLSSENLFLMLSRDLDCECNITRSAHMHECRMRSIGQSESLAGSAWSSLELSARVVCFVLKVAYEAAAVGSVEVLEGVYAEAARFFLDDLMGERLSWQKFFISSILRFRGEGCLINALHCRGNLENMEWCAHWANGLPTTNDDSVQQLRIAENNLAEARAEEAAMEREQRLCPHCRQPFIVAQTNCGQFTCGQDAHMLNGRPHLAGAQIGEHFGCGRQFQLANAPAYRADQGRLAELQDELDEKKAQIDACRHASILLEEAKQLQLPIVQVLMRREGRTEPLLPTRELLSETQTDSSANTIGLATLLCEASQLKTRLSCLPDLIEFYLWLHETFRFLLTRDFAFETNVGDIMEKAKLQSRFNRIKVQYILALWDRVRTGVNRVLGDTNYTVRRECEQIRIPFNKIEEAKLVCLLSDKEDDSNDVLFLLINETIDLYNDFAEKLRKYTRCRDTQDESKQMSPRFCIRGFGGAAKIQCISPASYRTLNWIAECCWVPNDHAFNVEEVADLLRTTIDLQDNPILILSPLDHLREPFYFRDDESSGLSVMRANVSVNEHDGLFYANPQDCHLAVDTKQRLPVLGEVERDEKIRQTLVDSLHSLDYEDIRSLLEGCRNFLDLMLGFHSENFISVGSVLACTMTQEEDQSMDTDNLGTRLVTLGFPTSLTEQQLRLIDGLDSHQFVELVQFACFQLASESYQFCNLPLCMHNPIKTEAKEVLLRSTRENLRSSTGKGVPSTQMIEEFCGEVLRFYEPLLVEHAAKANPPLRTFLLRNNCCDDNDEVFSALPSAVTIRNYVAVNQLLQQERLSLFFAGSNETALKKEKKSSSKKLLSDRWLWEENTDSELKRNHNKLGQHAEVTGRLWFESPKTKTHEQKHKATTARTTVLDASRDETTPGNVFVEPEDDTRSIPDDELLDYVKSFNAQTIQRWWRQCSTLCVIDLDSVDDKYHREQAALVLQAWWRQELSQYYFEASAGSDEDGQSAPQPPGGMTASKADTENAKFKSSNPVHPQSQVTYGYALESQAFRQFLDRNKLPPQAADVLINDLGIRTEEDLRMVVDECPDMLLKLPALDQFKLKKSLSQA